MKDEDILSLDEVIEEPSLPEAEVQTDPPADKHDVRDDSGKFAPKDGKKLEGKTEEKPQEKPEAKAEERPERSDDKVIPVAAHAAERAQWKQERKALEAKLAELEQQLTQLKTPQKPAEPPQPPPAFEQDPKGYVEHTIQSRVQAALEQLEGVKKQVETGQKTAEEARAEAQELQLTIALQTTEAEFKAQHPDYYDALAHLRQLRMNELSILHPQASQEEILAFMMQEERALARNLMLTGRNPHEAAYKLAETRGYKRKEEPPIPQQQQSGLKTLPPDQTLGSSSGALPSGEQFIDDEKAFDIAMAQVFGRRKAS